ncbi:hypothetical protein ACH5RR_003707 [Cinchona calisaya]|uniref:Uncharacterized protein n=1 Tax=Cinchona calisaya TaxID=153742 RepID=A0ABD3AVN5_9GENT
MAEFSLLQISNNKESNSFKGFLSGAVMVFSRIFIAVEAKTWDCQPVEAQPLLPLKHKKISSGWFCCKMFRSAFESVIWEVGKIRRLQATFQCVEERWLMCSRKQVFF